MHYQTWTKRNILGKLPYNTLEVQMLFPPNPLAQVCQACLDAWKKLPPKSGFSAAFTEVLQGADEPYNSFISWLMETSEHLFGVQEPENPFSKLNSLLLEMPILFAKIFLNITVLNHWQSMSAFVQVQERATPLAWRLVLTFTRWLK